MLVGVSLCRERWYLPTVHVGAPNLGRAVTKLDPGLEPASVRLQGFRSAM